MITVGTAYMNVPDAPVNEVLKDMLEMCRGVQHPLRGLFLRYYLIQCTRNQTLTINFLLTNFIEMNKLWVRLQHQGHSRDREKRTQERKELQIIVGSTLVRMSQLDNLEVNVYRDEILPAVLEQIVKCRDVIAQEYLMDVVTQVFPDEFHLETLDLVLQAVEELNPQTSVKGILVKFINRLADYSTRRADEENSDHEAANEGTSDGATDSKQSDDTETNEDSSSIKEDLSSDANEDLHVNGSKVEIYRGIPTNINLFEIFWNNASKLIEKRPDLPFDDISALCVCIARLSLCCYPEKTSNIDEILKYLVEYKFTETEPTRENILQLLLLLIKAYPKFLTVLSLDHFVPLLEIRPKETQIPVAECVVDMVLLKKDRVESVDDAKGLFKLLTVLIKGNDEESDKSEDQINDVENRLNDLLLGNEVRGNAVEAETPVSDEVVVSQGSLSKIVHLLYNDDVNIQLQLLEAARKALSDGGSLIRFTYPAIVMGTLKLIRRIKALEKAEPDDFDDKLAHTFQFLQQVLTSLSHSPISADKALRLFVEAGTMADQVNSEEASYEFYAQAFTIYEERISDSRSQYQAICLISAALQVSRNFSSENYDTLASKCALYGSKLLKKPDQCRAVYQASHLWWSTREDGFRDGKRVLECLQRSLRVADACMDIAISIELFVEILNRCLYYFEHGNEQVTVKFVTGLIELIQRNLDSIEKSANSNNISESPRKHFERTLKFLEDLKEVDSRFEDIVW